MKTDPEISTDLKLLLPLLEEEDTAVIGSDLAILDERVAFLKSAFAKHVDHAVAVKTHPHPRMLKHLLSLGCDLEAASMEEVRLALGAGAAPANIIFDSPVKTRQEIAKCAELPGLLANANTLEELERYPADACCSIGLRINPEIELGVPELYDVSAAESKFGVPISSPEEIIAASLRFPVTALHIHSGSLWTRLDEQIAALKSIFSLAEKINAARAEHGLPWRIDTIDIGGGLKTEPLAKDCLMAEYGRRLAAECPESANYRLRTEFGQWVHAAAGFALSRVEYVIPGDVPKAFIHLGADFFMRDAYTVPRPFPLKAFTADGDPKPGPPVPCDIAGPLCFAGDYLAKGTPLPQLSEGDWLWIGECGANTYGLWSRHCSRDLPKVLTLHGHDAKIWSQRKSIVF